MTKTCKTCGRSFSTDSVRLARCLDCRRADHAPAATAAAPTGPAVCFCGKTVLVGSTTCPRACSCPSCGSSVAHVHPRP